MTMKPEQKLLCDVLSAGALHAIEVASEDDGLCVEMKVTTKGVLIEACMQETAPFSHWRATDGYCNAEIVWEDFMRLDLDALKTVIDDLLACATNGEPGVKAGVVVPRNEGDASGGRTMTATWKQREADLHRVRPEIDKMAAGLQDGMPEAFEMLGVTLAKQIKTTAQADMYMSVLFDLLPLEVQENMLSGPLVDTSDTVLRLLKTRLSR